MYAVRKCTCAPVLILFSLAILHNVGMAQSVPRFEPSGCPFKYSGNQDQIQCGYLVVPENRSFPERKTLRLAVAIVKSISPVLKPDPIVFLSGGPGDKNLELLP